MLIGGGDVQGHGTQHGEQGRGEQGLVGHGRGEQGLKE